MQDYYQLLGVSKTATEKEIKSAYRKLALKWHPDRNKDNKEEAEEMFKKINKAYETLSNPEKKRVYDQLGHNAYEQYGSRAGGPGAGGNPYGGQGPFTYTYTTGNPQDFNFDFDFSNPFDIFEQFFGGQSPFGAQGQRVRRPVYTMTLTFDEAVKGIEKEAVISGKNRKIKIPAGVDSGMKIRFDEFDIQVDVKPHEFFKREDQNLILEKEISFTVATLGGTVEVPTLEKPVKLKVKPGTQPNAVMRLKDHGIPYPQGGNRKGDMYIIFRVTVPKQVSGKAKKLLQELEKELK
jgi:DnaJ-class molecular chaperone